MTTTNAIYVAIYTDGMGTYQARCMGCAWRGRWFRKEARAVGDGRTHVAHEIALADRPVCEAADDWVLPSGVDPGPCGPDCPKHGRHAPES